MAVSALATIRAQLDGSPVEIVLTERGWTGKGEGADDLAMTFGVLFGLSGYSPADGPLGAKQANDAVRWLKNLGVPAQVQMVQRKPDPIGTVY